MNIRMIVAIHLVACVGLGGCSSSSPGDERPVTPPRVSALPPPVPLDGSSGQCEPPIIYNPPSEEAWVAAATSIVVGTIDQVVLSTHPVVVDHSVWDADAGGSLSWKEFGSVNDCTSKIIYTADIHLKDVLTLNGEVMSDQLVIRVRRNQWALQPRKSASGGVEWYRFDDARADGLFPTGAIIGGAVVRSPVSGHLTFDFRMFEVFDGKVHLQRFDDAFEVELRDGWDGTDCPVDSYHAFMLDFAYDGVDWTDFQNMMSNLSVDRESLRTTNESVDRYLTWYHERLRDDGPISYVQFETTCSGMSASPEPEDPAIKNSGE